MSIRWTTVGRAGRSRRLHQRQDSRQDQVPCSRPVLHPCLPERLQALRVLLQQVDANGRYHLK